MPERRKHRPGQELGHQLGPAEVACGRRERDDDNQIAHLFRSRDGLDLPGRSAHKHLDLVALVRGRPKLFERVADHVGVDVPLRAGPVRGGLVQREDDFELVRLAGGEVCVRASGRAR